MCTPLRAILAILAALLLAIVIAAILTAVLVKNNSSVTSMTRECKFFLLFFSMTDINQY